MFEIASLPQNTGKRRDDAFRYPCQDAGSLDQLFEVASLLEGHLGLKRVRYFTFSKKTRTMLAVTPNGTDGGCRSTGHSRRHADTLILQQVRSTDGHREDHA